MAFYQYTPLISGKHTIRLLKLLPNEDAQSKVCCEIFHVDLSDVNHIPYEALSYTWGDASQLAEITLGGYVFPVTTNLEAALRALRKPTETRILWVDAICINQTDLIEQGAQVRIMWHVYKTADCVVVWLGLEEGDSSIAMDNFARREAQTKIVARRVMKEKPKEQRGLNWCGCHAGDFSTHPSRLGVQNLLGRHWFTRVWVLQEVAAAKQVVVVCGNKIVSGADFCDEIKSIASVHASFSKILRRIRPALELMSQSTPGMLNRSVTLIELIESFRTWNSTKPADKVYALLGFSSDASEIAELQADYTIAQSVLASRIVRFALPESVVYEQESQKDEVVFELQGLILGTIHGKQTSAERSWNFNAKSKPPNEVVNAVASSLFQDEWDIRIINERRLEYGGVVVLLRGATRPAILRAEKGQYIVDMLATPEPAPSKTSPSKAKGMTWATALSALANETDGLINFKLSWNPFRQPLPSEISRYVPAPNNIPTQWEAMIETLKDAAEISGESSHNCRSMAMLWMLYRSEGDKIKAGTSKYITSIHTVAYNNYIGTVKLLLDANVDVNTVHEESGTTALHLASMQGHTRIVQALVNARANPNLIDNSNLTPLEYAVGNGHADVCQLLLSNGANIKNPKTNQVISLFGPTTRDQKAIVSALLAAGADVNTTEPAGLFAGMTSLHMAAQLGHEDIAKLLLAAGVEVEAVTASGTRALHQAAMAGHDGVVKILLDAGADINARDNGGATPLDFAALRRSKETMDVLRIAGGKFNLISMR